MLVSVGGVGCSVWVACSPQLTANAEPPLDRADGAATAEVLAAEARGPCGKL